MVSSKPVGSRWHRASKGRRRAAGPISVDRKAIGYAPTDHLIAPGSHSVRALLPGQPGSAQTQSVEVANPGSLVAMDFAF